MINIIERELKIPAIKLTGDVDTQKGTREKLIQEFESSTIKNLFLMTTAGGEGIDLQCANYIILFDLPFNPQVIRQVEDRCHRFGQTQPVTVIKFLVKNTVEDRVLEILKSKTNLFNEVIDGKTGKPISVTQEELLKSVEEWREK